MEKRYREIKASNLLQELFNNPVRNVVESELI